MNKTLVAAACAASIATFGLASSARAGVYQDDLSRCLVKAMTPADQIAMVQWIFSAMALHPSVETMSKISADQHKGLNKGAAQLFQRLLVSDCRKETVAAVKYEGASAMTESFKLVGEVAMRNLMTDPKVAAGMAEMGSYADENAFESLAKEAGVSPPPGK